MSHTTTLALTSVPGGIISASVSAAAEIDQASVRSLLRSNVEQIFAGDFTLYGSDIATLTGILMSSIGIAVALYRVIKHKDV